MSRHFSQISVVQAMIMPLVYTQKPWILNTSKPGKATFESGILGEYLKHEEATTTLYCANYCDINVVKRHEQLEWGEYNFAFLLFEISVFETKRMITVHKIFEQ